MTPEMNWTSSGRRGGLSGIGHLRWIGHSQSAVGRACRPVILIHGYAAIPTTSYAAHYSYDGSGQLEASPGPTVETAQIDDGSLATRFA